MGYGIIDGWQGYTPLGKMEFIHEVRSVPICKKRVLRLLTKVHRDIAYV